MFKNVASQKVIVYAFDSTTNLPKTGDAANLTAYVSKDYGAVTVLGDTSATEMDATNAKGYYLFDLTQGETNGDTLLFSAKSSTANIVVIGSPATVFTNPPNFTSTSIDSNGRVDVIKIAGTTQTARDIGASVLLSAGTGTGQLDFTSGVVKANLAQILATALTETAGQLAGGFKKFFNIATPASTMDALTLVATATNLTNAPTNGDFTAAMKTSLNAATPASVTGAVGSVTGAVGSVTGNVGGNVVGSVASVTAGVTVTTNNDKTGYALTAGERTSIGTAIGTQQITESYRANGAAPTRDQALCETLAHLGEASISGTTKTVNKFDHVTAAETFTLDNALTPASITRAT